MEIETITAPWQTLPRGARINSNALEIMVDIDEVVCPTIDSIHNLAFDRGLHDGSMPMSTWRGHEQYGCDEQVYWDLWSDFALSGGYLNTEPIPGSVEALRRLYWEGHRIHFVTARGFMNHASDIRKWTPDWLAEFAVPFHTLTYAQDKVAVQELLGLRFDYAVDDSPRNFTELLADGVEVYLQNHPHNAAFETDRRVQNLDEFAEIILKEAV